MERTLRPLPAAHVKQAARLTAAAFLHSPSYCFIFEGLTEAARFDALAWLFEKNFELRLGVVGAARCAFDDDDDPSAGEHGRLICSFLLEPPDAPPVSAWAMVRAGILSLPVRYGARALVRLLAVKAAYESRERALLCGGDGGCDRARYCSLERMVVDPACQGRGVGRACLGAALLECESRGLGVFLSTQEPQNVRFYRRLGFEVLVEEPASFSAKVTNWFMVKRPPLRPPSSAEGGVVSTTAARSDSEPASRRSLLRYLPAQRVPLVVGLLSTAVWFVVLQRRRGAGRK
jgi:GNAT superfamily N-acetyltransferase